MNVLAFDTCFGAVSVALGWQPPGGPGEVRSAYEERQTGHAERLLPMIAEVMAGADLAFADLQRIAVTVGPGSFTGVRTGIATARALALASGIPVTGTTSLATMAAMARQQFGAKALDRPIAVAVDARRGEIYWQYFEPAMAAVTAPELLTLDAAVARVAVKSAIVVGTGAPLLAAAALTHGHRVDTALERLEPDALALLSQARDLPLLAPVAPLYLRAPDAKPQTGKSLPRARGFP